MKKDTVDKPYDIEGEVESIEHRIKTINSLLASKETLNLSIGTSNDKLFYNDQEVIIDILTKDLIKQKERKQFLIMLLIIVN